MTVLFLPHVYSCSFIAALYIGPHGLGGYIPGREYVFLLTRKGDFLPIVVILTVPFLRPLLPCPPEYCRLIA
jgi:hypothetical protein